MFTLRKYIGAVLWDTVYISPSDNNQYTFGIQSIKIHTEIQQPCPYCRSGYLFETKYAKCPLLISCILLNRWDLEATTALRQLWIYIQRIKVSQCDHLVIQDPYLQDHNTHNSNISEYFQPLNLDCWQVEFYNCVWMFQNLTIKKEKFSAIH